MTLAVSKRDAYIDFLRAFGLLLLVVAHTWPPAWLAAIRTFDVPLMVFISAMCYKPLRGGDLAYGIKRLKRIYVPVVIFLTIFFIAQLSYCSIFGEPRLELKTVIGSYLLLNGPSIGYVWIMRVFLMMALILPIIYKPVIGMNFTIISITIFVIVCLQHYLVMVVELIDNAIIRFILDETLLYAIGYTPVAIIGLKIRDFKQSQLYIMAIVSATAMLLFVGFHDWIFDPQQYKYPPQSLYLLYGVFASTILWLLKPRLAPITTHRIFTYLSENSMWIYLWHIIPVYIISRWADIPNMWVIRYCLVLFGALALSFIYKCIINLLPSNWTKELG